MNLEQELRAARVSLRSGLVICVHFPYRRRCNILAKRTSTGYWSFVKHGSSGE